jgi:hypothetical protein
MQFLAVVNNTRKVIPSVSDRQTGSLFLVIFSIRNRLYFVPKSKTLRTQHATMGVIFKRAVRDESKVYSSD